MALAAAGALPAVGQGSGTPPAAGEAGALEPPAAAQSGPAITPAQEAAEIRASGRFLPPLIPEGGQLVRANAHLGRDDFLGVWTIVLQDRVNGASNRSLILLPAGPVADMIARHSRSVRDGSSPPLFEVSGKILSFARTNFFLPGFAAPVTQVIEPSAPEVLSAPGSRAALAAASAPAAPRPTAKNAPVQGAAPAQVDPEQLAAELERRLLAQAPAVPVNVDSQPHQSQAPPGQLQPSRAGDAGEAPMPAIVPATTHTEDAPFVLPIPHDDAPAHVAGPSAQVDAAHATGAPGTSAQAALAAPVARAVLPPMRLQARRGVITRDPVTGAWRFVLSSGARDDGDYSIELLPCELLKSMIATARSRSLPVHVLLTGDVTVSQGRNYILPIKAVPIFGGRWIGP